jgi:hypothetical protein
MVLQGLVVCQAYLELMDVMEILDLLELLVPKETQVMLDQ